MRDEELQPVSVDLRASAKLQFLSTNAYAQASAFQIICDQVTDSVIFVKGCVCTFKMLRTFIQ